MPVSRMTSLETVEIPIRLGIRAYAAWTARSQFDHEPRRTAQFLLTHDAILYRHGGGETWDYYAQPDPGWTGIDMHAWALVEIRKTWQDIESLPLNRLN